MNEFYRRIARQHDVGYEWKKITVQEQSAKKLVGQFTMEGEQKRRDIGTKTYWWLGGSRDVIASGNFEACKVRNKLYFKNLTCDGFGAIGSMRMDTELY